jgi:redox-sensitive bicupin YhaK (pirin superfamily)
MRTLRKAAERGHTTIGWLDSWHTFAFGEYWDQDHVQFRALRVINDDRIAAGMGFGTHGHRDMEIVTWVLSGALEHKDSLGNGDVLRPGIAQRMSAGTGIRHSEFNPSPTEPVRLLQIWIEPDRAGTPASYDQKEFPVAERRDRWRRIVDNQGTDGALKMGADAAVFATLLSPGATVTHALTPGRHAWLQVASGRVRVGDRVLVEGDGLAVSEEAALTVAAEEESELLLFDLA